MAGLGRVQQRFNAAVVTLLTLAGLGRMTGRDAKRQAAGGQGHPIHAKYLRTVNVDKATGRDLPNYLGYCSGVRYDPLTGRKVKRVKQTYTRPAVSRGNWWQAFWTKGVMVVVTVLVLAAPAFAQSTVTVQQPLGNLLVQWSHNGKDQLGNATVVEEFLVQIDAQVPVSLGKPVPTSDIYLATVPETTKAQMTVGAHTLFLLSRNAYGDGVSEPMVLTILSDGVTPPPPPPPPVTGAPPSAPTGVILHGAQIR